MSNIKKKKPALASFDIGNGFVKWASARGQDSYLSAVSDVSGMIDGFGGIRDGERDHLIRYEGKSIVFGNSVYFKGSGAQVIRDTGRFTTLYYRQLFASALACSIEPDRDGQEVEIVLSLPPGKYFERDHLKSVLAGSYEIGIPSVDGFACGIYNVPIENIRVIPEGVGSICMNVLSETGKERNGSVLGRSVVGVVDVGTLTTDLIQLDALRIVRDGCWTEENAIYSGFYKRLMLYAATLGVTIPDYRCQDVIDRKYFMVQGEPHNIERLLTMWTKDLALIIDGVIRQHWHGGNDVEIIVLTGGGANYVINELQRCYRHIQLVSDSILDQVRANAIGGYRYGLLRRGTT